MGIQSKWVAALFCVSGLIILLGMLRSRHFFKAAALSAVSGLAALFAVNLLSFATGVAIGVNPITLGVSGLTGIPGVIMLLSMRLILK